MADAHLSQHADPLETLPRPERVNYATGVLLDAADFRDEQTYHRAALARMLRHLVGFGTVAGLRVAPPADADPELELRVEPGLAIDRWGRAIELAGPECIRLARWFDGQGTAALRAALHRAPRVAAEAAVVADVFLSAETCARAKTPAFATGPFDALDAVVPARLADAHRLELVPRAEGGPDPIPVPRNHWPDPAAAPEERLRAILGSWREGTAAQSDDRFDPLAEHVEGRDTAAVLLARIMIPVALAEDAPAAARPQLRLDQRVITDNSLRPFIFLPGKWLGQAPDDQPLILP